MDPLKAAPLELIGDDAKAQWQKPEIAKLSTAGAEGGDSFSGDGGGLS